MPRQSTLESLANAVWLPRDRIRANPDQPRRHFDEAELANLAESIQEHGILQPITVRYEPSRYDATPYLIVAGERRFRAASIAGLEKVPCLISDVDAATARTLALVENIQRRDLTALEEAHGLAALIEEQKLSNRKAAKALKVSEGWVNNRLSLLKTREDVQEVAAEVPLAMSSLLLIDTVKDEDARIEMLQMVRDGAAHSKVKERVEWHQFQAKQKAQANRAPDDQTQVRKTAHEQNGGGQMSRGRMVTGAPRDETRAQIEAALSELERQTKNLEAWAPKAESKYLRDRVEPRLARLRNQLRRIGSGA